MKVIIIFIIIILFFISRKSEHFDQRVDGATREECGIICTKTLGCNGFAYDKENKYCFLSKDPIVIRPLKKAYVRYYDRKFPRCNKLHKINDPYYNSRNSVIRNAMYECQETENDDKINNLIYDIREREWSGKKSDINKIKVFPYQFEQLNWNAIPSVSDGRFNTSLEVPVPSSKMTDGPILIDPDSTDAKNYNKSSGSPEMDISDNGPINLSKNMHLITNPTKSNSYIIMREYDNEFLGQYQYQHKCTSNISKEKCMKNCLENNDCVGTEWNPMIFKKIGVPNLYEFEENVCCPKKKINKVIPRRHEFRLGKFYMKEIVDKKSDKEGEILVGLNKQKKYDKAEDISEKYTEWKENIF